MIPKRTTSSSDQDPGAPSHHCQNNASFTSTFEDANTKRPRLGRGDSSTPHKAATDVVSSEKIHEGAVANIGNAVTDKVDPPESCAFQQDEDVQNDAVGAESTPEQCVAPKDRTSTPIRVGGLSSDGYIPDDIQLTIGESTEVGRISPARTLEIFHTYRACAYLAALSSTTPSGQYEGRLYRHGIHDA